MIFTIPTRYFFVCGSSEGSSPEGALDGAFLRAGIGQVNRLAVSAILPPGATPIEPLALPDGALVPSCCAKVSSSLPGEVISAAVAIALPSNPEQPGVITRYAACGHKDAIEAIVRRMAREGLARRSLELGDIHSLAVQHKVDKTGAAVAAVLLWD